MPGQTFFIKSIAGKRFHRFACSREQTIVANPEIFLLRVSVSEILLSRIHILTTSKLKSQQQTTIVKFFPAYV
jgi:hypothetical protein